MLATWPHVNSFCYVSREESMLRAAVPKVGSAGQSWPPDSFNLTHQVVLNIRSTLFSQLNAQYNYSSTADTVCD